MVSKMSKIGKIVKIDKIDKRIYFTRNYFSNLDQILNSLKKDSGFYLYFLFNAFRVYF